MTYPSGRQVRYTYESKGRVSAVDTRASASVGTWTGLASGVSYEPFGAVKAMTLGNGLAVANDWGADGWLASRRLYRSSDGTNRSWLTYTHDSNGNNAAIDDQVTPASSVLYGYDKVDRLKLAASQGASGGESASYGYTSGTNQLASVTTAAGTRTVSYDGRGNTASESRPNSIAVTTDYDGYGRLTAYTRTGTQALTFAYNGLDDRVGMQAGSDMRRFVYDGAGRVLGEYGNSAADVKAEFIWLLPGAANDNAFGGTDGTGGYAPLAVATPDLLGAVQLRWVHGNHLGVPVVTTDAGGDPVVPGDYLAPGFPGQSRVLADLYYNRYRDYDPTTGRYIQADPIGLAGGSNDYSYVGGNPVNAIDPMGLATGPMSRPPPAGSCQNPNEYGSRSCSYYASRCRSEGGIYYCRLAPLVCSRTTDSRWSRCVRQCLQDNDRLYCQSKAHNFGGGSDLPCIINIHQMCWQECISRGIPPSTRVP